MDETKLTAHLPSLDVEIVRRDLPDENAEVMTIRMKATPSVEAAARFFAPQVFAPRVFAPQAMMLMSAPALLWMRMAQEMWRPWLDALAPPVLPKRD